MINNLEKNQKIFIVLKASFRMTLVFWAVILIFPAIYSDPPPFDYLIIFFGEINGFIFLTHLGVLVSQANKSVFIWIVATIFFSILAIGPIISYLKIKRIATKNGWH